MSAQTESRLVELESRLTEQERIIEQLNEVIIEQGLSLHRMEEKVRMLADAMSGSGGDSSNAGAEPPPPHY